MKKIVLIVVVVAVVVSIAAGVVAEAVSTYRIYPTYITEMSIERERLSPSHLFVRILVDTNCNRPWIYGGMRLGDNVLIWVLTIRNVRAGCTFVVLYEERSVPIGRIGRDFTEGVNYTVRVNRKVETFSVESLTR